MSQENKTSPGNSYMNSLTYLHAYLSYKTIVLLTAAYLYSFAEDVEENIFNCLCVR